MDTEHTNQPEQACRPLDHLAAVGWLYPEAWRQIDRFINSKGKNGLPDWPEWCFLPMEAFYAIISQEADVVACRRIFCPTWPGWRPSAHGATRRASTASTRTYATR